MSIPVWVRINPHHPLAPYIRHALVSDSAGHFVDITGSSHRVTDAGYSASHFVRYQHDIGLITSRGPANPAQDQFEPFARDARLNDNVTFLLGVTRRAGNEEPIFTAHQTALGPVDEYNVGIWRQNFSNRGWSAFVGLSGSYDYKRENAYNSSFPDSHVAGMTYQGNLSGWDRIQFAIRGTDLTDSMVTVGTAPSGNITTDFDRLSIGHRSTAAYGEIFFGLVLVNASLLGPQLARLTGDMRTWSTLFRGPTVQIPAYKPEGAASEITGNITGTIDLPVAALTGGVEVTGDVTGTIALPVAALVGGVEVTGDITGSIALPVAALSGYVGYPEILGNITGTIANPVGALTGVTPIFGDITGSIALPVAALTGTVKVEIFGNITAQIALPVAALTGVVPIVGDITGTISLPLAAMTGSVADRVSTGNITGTLDNPVGALVASTDIAGDITGTIDLPIAALYETAPLPEGEIDMPWSGLFDDIHGAPYSIQSDSSPSLRRLGRALRRQGMKKYRTALNDGVQLLDGDAKTDVNHYKVEALQGITNELGGSRNITTVDLDGGGNYDDTDEVVLEEMTENTPVPTYPVDAGGNGGGGKAGF